MKKKFTKERFYRRISAQNTQHRYLTYGKAVLCFKEVRIEVLAKTLDLSNDGVVTLIFYPEGLEIMRCAEAHGVDEIRISTNRMEIVFQVLEVRFRRNPFNGFLFTETLIAKLKSPPVATIL